MANTFTAAFSAVPVVAAVEEAAEPVLSVPFPLPQPVNANAVIRTADSSARPLFPGFLSVIPVIVLKPFLF